MKVLLLAGGVLFLVLGILLVIAAAIAYFLGKKRAAAGAAPVRTPAPQPYAPAPQQSAPAPQQYAPAPQQSVPQPAPPMATVVLDVREMHAFGALHGVSGPLTGRTINIEARGFYIGRDATVSQVLIDDARVSKRHVWIGVRDGAVMAVDEGSTNGTFLNDTANRIREARLSPGDTLIISQDVARLTYQR